MNNQNSNMVSMHDLTPIIIEQLSVGGEVRFTATGTSMLPMLHDRVDTVTLKRREGRLKKYDIPLYLRPNGQYVLHRVLKVTENGYCCAGDNQTVLERDITDESVIGVVSGFTHKRKPKTVDSLLYKIYCRLWCVIPLRRICLKFTRRLKRFLCKPKKNI